MSSIIAMLSEVENILDGFKSYEIFKKIVVMNISMILYI
jgi:hypothetical protein